MKERGFTLIELLVVISIISLLSSVVMSSINSARSKARFATVMSQMREIKIAATNAFTTTGNYAADVGPGVMPSEFATYMPMWPTPPCPNWTYDWENWGTGFIGLTIRNASVGGIYYLCIDDSVTCSAGAGTNIMTVSNRSLSCS